MESLSTETGIRPSIETPVGRIPVGPVELLIIQPTPFCNINCRYCYLPDRGNKQRISIATVATLTRRVVSFPGLVEGGISVLWHAGEPTALPSEFYAQAFDAMREVAGTVKIEHAMQTNATLLDEGWIDFIQQQPIRLGVSLDGPEALHDRNRVHRSGKGTHALVMRSVARLQARNVPFRVIAVVTRETLACPDAFYDFFRDHGMQRVALNIDEVELFNRRSSMAADTPQLYEAFLRRLFERSLQDASVQFRELSSMRGVIASEDDRPHRFGQLTRPLGVVTCDCEGNVSSFSPELSGAKSPAYADFILGNVHTDDFESMLRSRAMQRMLHDIQSGIQRCERSCAYFSLCGGGTPANKFFENGTFDSTETIYCLHSRKAVIDAALIELERHFLQQV